MSCERSRKYRSTNVYTSNYLRHRTVQCGRICQLTLQLDSRAVGPTSRVAHRFGSGKLYICLSNKCFNHIQRICSVTDVRPSQDHRILRVQTVQINLAHVFIKLIGPYWALQMQIIYWKHLPLVCRSNYCDNHHER